jgi:hypothetical protein
MGGALKGMLSAYTILKGRKLLKDRKTILLTRDR